MKVLVIDVGGTHVKILATGQKEAREFESAPTMTAAQMVAGVKSLADGWRYDAVTVGYPGPVLYNRPAAEPHNLGRGWAAFDFASAFGVPAKVINDAAMQALGSYRSGKMLFLGLGTGLGSALVVDGNLMPMELGHLPYKDGTYETYLGLKGLKRLGITKWRECVHRVVVKFISALELDDVVIGGGNATKLDKLPPGCRAGDNALAFRGGFLLWEKDGRRKSGGRAAASSRSPRKN
jgi:polyphosphate glucokinase